MEAVIVAFALLFVLLVSLGGYATVKAVGAARRGVDRTLTQARRTVEDHTLRAKSFAQPGPAGEIAELRLKLRTSMRATRDALQAGAAEDASLKESLTLFDRLSAHGHELDGELRRLESEPDRAALTERLPALRERTERITHSADSLRWAARDRARRFAEDDLESLTAQIDMEAGALRHWDTAEQSAAPSSAPGGAAGHAAQSPAGAAGGDPAGSTPGSAADGHASRKARAPQSHTPGEPSRPVLGPSARRPAYPWQKKARPESTT
ncbi:MAG TPA: hypothetical protein VFP69_09760 [Streptomyces sp.]|nr:hypothetical protein [Streptomyces sp.]